MPTRQSTGMISSLMKKNGTLLASSWGTRPAASVAIALLLAAACGCGGNADAATQRDLERWVGCYDVTISKDGSHIHEKLRLTATPIPATAGAYAARLMKSTDHQPSLSNWWPVDDDSFYLSGGDGYLAWSVTLKSSGSRFEGETRWADDIGRRGSGWRVSVVRIPCDAEDATQSQGQTTVGKSRL